MAKEAEFTALATQVRETFQRFAAFTLPSIQPAKTVLQCWCETFGAEGGPLGFFERLGLVERSLQHLTQQVGLSTILDDEMRIVDAE
jgi:hypothetical protein